MLRLTPLRARRTIQATWIAVLLGLLSGCTSTADSARTFSFQTATQLDHVYPVQDREPAGTLSGSLLGSSGTFRLAQDSGHVVVVNFWSSSCNPCRVEAPQFDSVYRAYRSKGVKFIGIDFKDDRSDGERFVSQNHISYPNVYDQQGKTALELGKLPAFAIPFTVLVDKQGRVAGVYLGAMQPKDLEAVLNMVLTQA